MTPTFDRTVPVLRIFDVAKARDFYVGFLGFTIDFEHRFEPDLPLYMQVSRNTATLGLSEHYGDCSPGAKVIIEMSGLDDYHASLLAKRYQFARPGVQQQPWGARTMTIADPFFNHIVFSERVDEVYSGVDR